MQLYKTCFEYKVTLLQKKRLTAATLRGKIFGHLVYIDTLAEIKGFY